MIRRLRCEAVVGVEDQLRLFVEDVAGTLSYSSLVEDTMAAVLVAMGLSFGLVPLEFCSN